MQLGTLSVIDALAVSTRLLNPQVNQEEFRGFLSNTPRGYSSKTSTLLCFLNNSGMDNYTKQEKFPISL
jgi:hypothetical protein